MFCGKPLRALYLGSAPYHSVLQLVKEFIITALVVGASVVAHAQTSRASTERALYREANAPAAVRHLRAELTLHAAGFLNSGLYQVGYLRLLDGHRILVPGLRYHLSQRVLQVQDSLQADSTHYWPLVALRGFDLGTEDDIPPDVHRYRTRLVQEGHQTPQPEAVEVLTATDAGPLLLGWLTRVGSSGPMLVAGPGKDDEEPLRPLELSQAAVLRLCGRHASDIQTFASIRQLRFNQPEEIAKMFDQYNRLAVAK
jgi:hypothetical protein